MKALLLHIADWIVCLIQAIALICIGIIYFACKGIKMLCLWLWKERVGIAHILLILVFYALQYVWVWFVLLMPVVLLNFIRLEDKELWQQLTKWITRRNNAND